MNGLLFINVSGFGTSGSSAVVDLLKEFKNTYECETEIRFIADPYGLCDLEKNLVTNWELINSAIAINNYLDMCKIWARKGGGHINPLARAGMDYCHKINKDFYQISNDYICRLSKFHYYGDYYAVKFMKPYLEYVIDRIRYAIQYYSKGKICVAKNIGRLCYFSHPTQEEFNLATQEYIDTLFENYQCGNDVEYIILDQAVSANNTQVIHRYFKRAKMIIVDRDPRDMYVDDIVNWGVYRENADSAESGRRYVEMYRALHEGVVYDEDILKIQFEDLVLDYDSTKKKIMEFLGWGESDHICPKKYLKPEVSRKNVGIWGKYYSDYEMALDVIGKELKDYCFRGE